MIRSLVTWICHLSAVAGIHENKMSDFCLLQTNGSKRRLRREQDLVATECARSRDDAKCLSWTLTSCKSEWGAITGLWDAAPFS